MSRMHACMLLVIAMLSSCTNGGSSDTNQAVAKEPGTEKGPCFPNNTCMAGLKCLSEVCVSTGTGGNAGTGGSSAGGTGGILVGGSSGTGGIPVGGSSGQGGSSGTGGSVIDAGEDVAPACIDACKSGDQHCLDISSKTGWDFRPPGFVDGCGEMPITVQCVGNTPGDCAYTLHPRCIWYCDYKNGHWVWSRQCCHGCCYPNQTWQECVDEFPILGSCSF